MERESVNGIPKFILAAIYKLAVRGTVDMNELSQVIVNITNPEAKDWLRKRGQFGYIKACDAMQDYLDEIGSNTFAT